MKKISFKKLLFLPLLFLMIVSSCQEEVTEVTDPNNEETLVANSNLANLMRFTATNDGSVDNIIDFANCLEVQLPVTVIVNDITITINSFEDLDLIEAIFDEFEDDENDIEIVFPIVIISADYTEIVIESQEALEELIEDCNGENEEDDDIECIDFQYPITISIYDTDFEVIDIVTINDDEALYHFIEDLDGGVLASINYPVTMILANGDTIEVANNTELEAAISDAEDDCDEDDDHDWDDDDIEDCNFNLEELEGYLLECNMEAYIYDSNGDIIDINNLDFNTDGELIVNGEPTVTEVATWALTESATGYVLTINGLVTFGLLNGEWMLEGCDGDEIILSQDTGSGVMTMELEQDCIDIPGCSEAFVNAFLIECFWYVETNLFDIFVPEDVYFLSDGTVEIYNSVSGDLTTTGTWNVSSDSGGLYLNLELEIEPYSMLNVSWEMIECDEDRFEFVNGDDTLLLEQVCENCDNPGTLTNGLIIYMPFSNETHELIEDVSITSFVDYVEDRNGNSTCAISFTGDDEFSIPVTENNQLKQGDSLTVSLWFKMQNTVAGDLEIMFQKGERTSSQGFKLGVYDLNTPLVFDNTDTLALWDNDWNTEVDVEWENTDWHHLVVTVDSENTVRLYRDGVQRNVDENSDFDIGSDPLSSFILGDGFIGHLDDLRVYRRALNTSEIEQLFNLDSDCYTCL